MKTVQTFFSSASLTHCFWLITGYFAQIWEGGLKNNHVHPAVCPHGLPWTQGTVAGLGEPVWAGLLAAHRQSCTFNTLCALTSLQPGVSRRLQAPSMHWAWLGASSWTALDKRSPWDNFCSSQNLPAQALRETWRMWPFTTEPEITKAQTYCLKQGPMYFSYSSKCHWCYHCRDVTCHVWHYHFLSNRCVNTFSESQQYICHTKMWVLLSSLFQWNPWIQDAVIANDPPL